MIQKKQNNLRTFKIAGLVLLFTAAFFLSPFLNYYFGRVPFDSERWKNWEETEMELSTRWDMVRSLTRKHDLIGMKRSEVISLLGEPENEGPSTLSYNLGITGRYIDTGSIQLYLNEMGEVESYKIIRG